MNKQYAITYMNYVLAVRDSAEEAQAYAAKAEKDPEILRDMSQRDLLGPSSEYISVSDVTGQTI